MKAISKQEVIVVRFFVILQLFIKKVASDYNFKRTDYLSCCPYYVEVRLFIVVHLFALNTQLSGYL